MPREKNIRFLLNVCFACMCTSCHHNTGKAALLPAEIFLLAFVDGVDNRMKVIYSGTKFLYVHG